MHTFCGFFHRLRQLLKTNRGIHKIAQNQFGGFGIAIQEKCPRLVEEGIGKFTVGFYPRATTVDLKSRVSAIALLLVSSNGVFRQSLETIPRWTDCLAAFLALPW